MKLQRERMQIEVQAKAQGKSVAKPVIGVALLLVAIFGGLGFKMFNDNKAALAAVEAEKAALAAENRKIEAEMNEKISAIKKETDAALAAATSEEERQRIKSDAAAKQVVAQQEAASRKKTSRPSRGGGGGSKASSPKAAAEEKPSDLPAPIKKIQKKAVSDNPLDGLNL